MSVPRARRGSHSRSRPTRSRHRRRKDRKRGHDHRDPPHFDWEPGMDLGPDRRYVAHTLLGEGTFGRVLGCVDTATNCIVAVKVVKGVKRFCEHAEAEAEILQEVQRLDVGGQSLCVRLLDSFIHPRYHFCMVFEPLDMSIRDFLKGNKSTGLFLTDARQLACQLMQSLSFLHGIGLTHTDLKCRNIMLRNASFDLLPHPREPGLMTRRLRDCRMAVIDFGGAVFEEERHSARVGTRQFRAPEVVLGLPWDETVDMWSAGCIIAMLYIGKRLFNMHEDMEHLATIERILEVAIPPPLALEAMEQPEPPSGVRFTERGHLVWPEGAEDEDAVERVRELPPLRKQVCARHDAFLRLLQGLLAVDPQRRLSAKEALGLPFFGDVGAQLVE